MNRKLNGAFLSETQIFILGMPRSGSTLIEQILASHRNVVAGGELRTLTQAIKSCCDRTGASFPQAAQGWTEDDFNWIGTNYLRQLGALASDSAKPGPVHRVTDKKPGNFRNVGLIRLLFPNARIIHTRRNPVDTCLSCFSLLFETIEFSYDLRELGRRYRAYDRLMAHWNSVLPAGSMLEVDYEKVVDDTEFEVRRLLTFCGLDWHPDCLAFHQTSRSVRTASAAQVRQPIYRSSVKRWRPSDGRLRPLLDELGLDSADHELS
jgi:hypothetical protein